MCETSPRTWSWSACGGSHTLSQCVFHVWTLCASLLGGLVTNWNKHRQCCLSWRSSFSEVPGMQQELQSYGEMPLNTWMRRMCITLIVKIVKAAFGTRNGSGTTFCNSWMQAIAFLLEKKRMKRAVLKQCFCAHADSLFFFTSPDDSCFNLLFFNLWCKDSTIMLYYVHQICIGMITFWDWNQQPAGSKQLHGWKHNPFGEKSCQGNVALMLWGVPMGEPQNRWFSNGTSKNNWMMWGYPHFRYSHDIPMNILQYDGQFSRIPIRFVWAKTVTRTALPIQSVAAILKSDLDQGWAEHLAAGMGWIIQQRI